MANGNSTSIDDILIPSSVARRRYSDNGPDRRFPARIAVRTTPYPIPQGREEAWRRSIVPDVVLTYGDAPEPEPEPGTKLYISNLDYDVTNQDIKLLFSEMGELKRYSIHYDRSGRSKGTAEVVFIRQSDALAAIKKYNNMKLDGRPLQIEIVGTNLATPDIPLPPHVQSSLPERPNNFLREQGQVLSSRYHNSFPSGHLLPRGRGEVREHSRKMSFRDPDHGVERDHRRPKHRTGVQGNVQKVSVKELDDELERYHIEGMLLNRQKAKGNRV